MKVRKKETTMVQRMKDAFKAETRKDIIPKKYRKYLLLEAVECFCDVFF